MKTRMQDQRLTITAAACLVFGLVFSLPCWSLDAEEILTAFRDSYKWMDNVAMKVEVVQESLSTEKWKKPVSGDDLYNDKIRSLYSTGHTEIDFYRSEEKGWRKVGNFYGVDQLTGKQARNNDGSLHGWPINEGYFKAAGDVFMDLSFYDRGRASLSLEPFTEKRRLVKERHCETAFLLGNFFPFSPELLPDLLSPDMVKISEDSLDGEASCLVEVQSDYGHIQLWLSPEQNYCMQQVILTKEMGRDLNWYGDGIYGEDYEGTVRIANVQATRVLRTGEIEGCFVPLEIERKTLDSKDGDLEARNQSTITLSNIRLNPDFEALEAFELTVYDDASISIRDWGRRRYSDAIWENGKPVFDIEDKELEARSQEFLKTVTVKKTTRFTKMRRWASRTSSKIGAYASFLGKR
ncbi:MAG: hypothetical protein GX130_09085 [Candidatus Hydrogenedens sp.]|nr:hypothetical protein [Candidatus Hydrogenedens sp.]